MSDKELLELAAKAAGVELIFKNELGRDEAFIVCGDEPFCVRWTPLTNDGDALRLAVKLATIGRFSGVEMWPGYVTAHHHDNRKSDDEMERYGNDPYAATRRAIVRAAAEIGKGME